MHKGMALLLLRNKMTNEILGPPEEPDFMYSVVDFLNNTNLDELTEDNILDKYIYYLESILEIPHLIPNN